MCNSIVSTVLLAAVLMASSTSAQMWRSTDGPEGGIVHDVAVGPTGRLYAAIGQDVPRGGGLFVSGDGGVSG